MAPGTLLTAVHAVKGFLKYLTTRRQMTLQEEGIAEGDLSSMLQAAEEWHKGLGKQTCLRIQAVKEQQFENLIPANVVQEILTSLGPLSTRLYNLESVSAETMISLRSMLIFRLLVANSQRCGAVVNLTNDHFKRRTTKEGLTIVKVKTHKTSETYGDVNLVISQYPENVRRTVAGHMAHSTETQQKYYILQEKEQQARRAFCAHNDAREQNEEELPFEQAPESVVEENATLLPTNQKAPEAIVEENATLLPSNQKVISAKGRRAGWTKRRGGHAEAPL